MPCYIRVCVCVYIVVGVHMDKMARMIKAIDWRDVT